MCKKTENLDFGHEGVFWANYDLGKSCRAYKNTFKNIFPNEKIWLLGQLMAKNVKKSRVDHVHVLETFSKSLK